MGCRTGPPWSFVLGHSSLIRHSDFVIRILRMRAIPMSNTTALPGIWIHTSGDAFNAPRPGGYLSFLTDEQQARLERIRQSRMLLEGPHRKSLLERQLP